MRAWCPSCDAERIVPFSSRDWADYMCPKCNRPLLKPPARGKRRPLAIARPISPAADPQREKVKSSNICIGCGAEGDGEHVVIDPAHLVKRSQGGCDSVFCVVGLCRRPLDGAAGCHRSFDDGELDLLPIIVRRLPAELAEIQHMLEHLGPVQMVERLANARVEWRSDRRLTTAPIDCPTCGVSAGQPCVAAADGHALPAIHADRRAPSPSEVA